MDKKILLAGCDPATMLVTTVIIEKALGTNHEVIIVNNHEVKDQLREQFLNEPEPMIIHAPPPMPDIGLFIDKKGNPLPQPKSKYHK